MKKSNETINMSTGEITQPKLNEVIIHTTRRENGTLRIQQDFSNCPSLAEQHTAHLTDINYLISKYQPDELAAYMAARNQYRQEILGHNFAQEPSLQDAKNVVYQSRQAFDALDPDIKNHFSNHVEFLKFIDNPANQEKMLKLGILKKTQLDELLIPDPTITTPQPNQTLQPQTPNPTKPN